MSINAEVLNNLLNPVLHQVLGSTPASLVNSIKEAGLKGKEEVGIQLAIVSIYAAAVNKSTVETFISQSDLASVRTHIRTSFSINGSPNMTAFTLLGHCIYASRKADDVIFVKEFRKKMGQSNIWEGNLEAGSLSEKQKNILKEKAKNINHREATLLGNGFFKFIGADKSAMTEDEAKFWAEPFSGNQGASSAANTASSSRSKPLRRDSMLPIEEEKPKRPASPPASSAETVAIRLTDGTTAYVDRRARDYYLKVRNDDHEAMVQSIETRGADKFSFDYVELSKRDPLGRGLAGSVVG